MTGPNPAPIWGRVLVDGFVRQGVSSICVAPGSRSTSLILAAAEHDDLRIYSHLDERSGAYFALGRAKATGVPTPVVTTSGTAAANLHPAILEADRARVPMIAVTADRPPELWDSGANQTVDQVKLYGDAVRWYRTVPEPQVDERKLSSLRKIAARAVTESLGTPPGPVHLNVPFRKPFEPESADNLADRTDSASRTHLGNAETQAVKTAQGRPTLAESELDSLAEAIKEAHRCLLVVGPLTRPDAGAALVELGRAIDAPLLADPLSGLRFGPHTNELTVCGGYDSYLDPTVTDQWPPPDLVLRVGAAPTSTTLQEYLKNKAARQYLVDPSGAWREATFSATDLVIADPGWLARSLAERLASNDQASRKWRQRFNYIENQYWSIVEQESTGFEGAVLTSVLEKAPDPATLFVSNSTPVRDLDRFGRPSTKALRVFGNRGVSGIDGITSTALGTGSAIDQPLVLVTGDLAFYHDMNGLLALKRCEVEATIVVINNDGGGIFHMLPIEDFEPPFTELFKTPHGLDFSATEALYEVEFTRVESIDAFEEAYQEALSTQGSQVVEVTSDAEASHKVREQLHQRVKRELGDKS